MGRFLRPEAGMMHRFYVEQDQVFQGIATLTPEDARHALRVLRMEEGAEAEILGDGRRYRARMLESREDAVRFQLTEPLATTEPELRITLFQGLPKADRMEWVIQKAVEVGVHAIVPVRMARCIVKLDEREAERKQERWQRIAREAGKQCGRCLLPAVSPVRTLQEIFRDARELDACAVPWEEADTFGPGAFTTAHPDIRSLGILIGPEGGIEPGEIASLAGVFEPITLGPRILRTETAGPVAAAVMLALRGEMEHAAR